MSADVDASLDALGYTFVPGPTGNPSDWVLRQRDDTTKGFQWRGQVPCEQACAERV